jgi:hypothetical protein
MEHDPHNYLGTEARIISESDGFLVIALRVEKAFFARNLLLLAALAEMAPPALADVSAPGGALAPTLPAQRDGREER